MQSILRFAQTHVHSHSVRLALQVRQAFERLPLEEQMAGIALAARLRASEDERARRDREEAARVQGSAKSSEELKQVIVESEVRRRRLGQRTSANELSQEGVQRALYGDMDKQKVEISLFRGWPR